MAVIAKEKQAKTTKTMAKTETQTESVFEKAIILQPTEINVGSIKTNIEAVLAAVKEKSEQYQDLTKYNGDEKQAKEDRALLRKQKDMTKTTIASIQEAWNKPLESFLSGSKQILKQFDYAIDTIDNWVKEGEALEKNKKRDEIQAYFDTKGFDLVQLDKFFDDKWLNKTYKMTDIKKEIDSVISAIYSNIKILENIAEYGLTAKAFYLETLDMGEAMRQVETLKANAERLAREKVERETREVQAQVAQNAVEEREAEKAERVKSLAAEALDLPEPAISARPKIYEVDLRIWATEIKLKSLKEWMTINEVAYEKIAKSQPQ